MHTGCNSVPGPIPEDQVSSCPPSHCVSHPPLGVQPGHALVYIHRCCTDTGSRATHPAAHHSVAQSSPHRRSRSQSPRDLHRNAHVGHSGMLGRRTSRYPGQRRGGRVEWDGEEMAYLGTGVRRHLGHRVHRLSRQSPDDNCTAHFRLCHPGTHRGHCRGFWDHRGKLGHSVDVKCHQTLVRASAICALPSSSQALQGRSVLSCPHTTETTPNPGHPNPPAL